MANFFETPIGRKLLELLFQWLLVWLQSTNVEDAKVVGTTAGAFAKGFKAGMSEDADV